MPKIIAFLRTHNDAARIGRALDSLRACDEILVIDDRSEDGTAALARLHGAQVQPARPGAPAPSYLAGSQYDWVLCLRPTEAVSEALEAWLFLWKQTDPGLTPGFLIGIREESAAGWKTAAPEMRLVNRHRVVWTGELPRTDPDAPMLEGHLLRFSVP